MGHNMAGDPRGECDRPEYWSGICPPVPPPCFILLHSCAAWDKKNPDPHSGGGKNEF